MVNVGTQTDVFGVNFPSGTCYKLLQDLCRSLIDPLAILSWVATPRISPMKSANVHECGWIHLAK